MPEICLRARVGCLSGSRQSDGTMFAWILILASWIALLSLILHDATKEDLDGSAISIAAKKIKAAFWGILRTRKLRAKPSSTTSQTNASKPPVKITIAVAAMSSSSGEIRQGQPSINKQAPALPPKKWWGKDHRHSMTIPELELAISEAVKSAAPGCEDFVGVIVEHKIAKSRLDPNWAVRGVKFGKADRRVVDEALTTVVERLQAEFLLSKE